MSLKIKILQELEKGPKQLRYLKGKFGNNKKVAFIVTELIKQNRLEKRGDYITLRKKNESEKKAVIIKINRGYGFAKLLGETEEEVFVPGRFLLGALPGDEVQIRIKKSEKNLADGTVQSILKQHNSFVGTVRAYQNKLMFEADGFPSVQLLIRKGASKGAKPGEKVAVTVLSRGRDYNEHQVEVSIRFGSELDAQKCAQAILYGLGIPQKFSEEADKQAEETPKKVDLSVANNRLDLRDKIVFTIDSATTKDMDDAISIERVETGYRLAVHIADVSHYVKEKTPIDEEAYNRGTSVYYADCVVPMLPPTLSNGICSLNEGENRFAFSCIIDLSLDGAVEKYQFQKTIINSVCKGVYQEINLLLENKQSAALQKKYENVMPSLRLMLVLYEKLAKRRAARGSMEIESNESKIIVNSNGVAIGVEKRERGISEKIIEEFMLLANTCAAKYAQEKELPFLYRTHDAPEQQRVDRLKELLRTLGVPYHFAKEQPTQTELAELLSETKGTNLETVVHLGVLHTMAKAVYSPEPKGHYGLALQDYTHFTSPIRRYPDLLIHHILSDALAGKSGQELEKTYGNFVKQAANKTTAAEIRAMTAERNCEDCYQAEFMKQFVGETFEGIITSVTTHGIYLELPNTVEGMVSTAQISKNALVLKQGVSLVDTISGTVYRVGEPLKVTLASVNITQGHIDFVLA